MRARWGESFPAVCLATILMAGAADAWSQEPSRSPPPPPERLEQAVSPVEWFTWGGDVRLRHDSSQNAYLVDADPPGYDSSFERFRIREWNTLRPTRASELNVRVIWEGRHFWMPRSVDTWDRSEIVIDGLNAKLRFQEVPVVLILGRQDIIFGEGWLVFEGTPLDGPRTSYFDAARATIDVKGLDGVLDLIYVDQASSPNRWLSPIFSKGRPLMEQNERGAIVNLATRWVTRTPIDAYFIYKHDEAVLRAGDDGDVYTLGGRLAHDFDADLSGRVEGAYQFGRRRNAVMFPGRDADLSAWGLTSRVSWGLGGPSKGQAWLGYEVLSGNGAHGARNHQFDPLWGRWARYSELFPDDLDRTGDKSNLHRVNLGYQAAPASGVLLQANYHALFAYADRFAGTPGFSDHGRFKGHLFTGLVRYRHDRSWSGHVLGEYFIPGGYYQAAADGGPLHTRRDPAAFLRAELVFSF